MADSGPGFDWRHPPDWVWRALVFLVALGLLLLITTRWSIWRSNATSQSTDDAYLQSDLTPIAAKVPGYVRTMPVEDFQKVRAGQLIAEIVDDDYRATVAQLTAAVAAAAAQVEALKAQQELQKATIHAAHAAVAGSTANLEQNARDVQRQKQLLSTGSSSTEAGEKLQTTCAQLTARRHDAGANSEFDVVRAEGLVAQARAAIPPLEGQRRAAWFQLAALLGRTPADAPAQPLECAKAPQLIGLIPAGDGAALLKRRPDIRQAERRLAGATARPRAANRSKRAGRARCLRWHGSAGAQGDRAGAIDLPVRARPQAGAGGCAGQGAARLHHGS